MTFIATRELSFGAVRLNLGAGQLRYRDTAADTDTRSRRASVAPVWNITEHFKLVADAGLEWLREDGAESAPREKFFEFGTICSPTKNLDFALGLIRRSDNQSPQSVTHSATLGVTWRY